MYDMCPYCVVTTGGHAWNCPNNPFQPVPQATGSTGETVEQAYQRGFGSGWRARGEADVKAVEEWPLRVANMEIAHHWFKLIKPASTACSHAVASVCRVALPKVIREVVLPVTDTRKP